MVCVPLRTVCAPQVSARLRGNIQVQKTVVARNTNLMRCLAEFCGLEVLHGVHCPRYLDLQQLQDIIKPMLYS